MTYPHVWQSSTENSYNCKYLANEDMLDSNMTAESQIKLGVTAYFIVEFLYLFAIMHSSEKLLKDILILNFNHFKQCMYIISSSWSILFLVVVF